MVTSLCGRTGRGTCGAAGNNVKIQKEIYAASRKVKINAFFTRAEYIWEQYSRQPYRQVIRYSQNLCRIRRDRNILGPVHRFRMRGFSVTETGGGGSDGGIDLVLKKHGEIFLVQCKQWCAYKVSVNVVRELLGVMVAQGATGGFVVTSGSLLRRLIHLQKDRILN